MRSQYLRGRVLQQMTLASQGTVGVARLPRIRPARGSHAWCALSHGWFANAVLVTQAVDPRLTPHDLRHTAASLAISSGANVKAVQRMLGHASAAMTLDT